MFYNYTHENSGSMILFFSTYVQDIDREESWHTKRRCSLQGVALTQEKGLEACIPHIDPISMGTLNPRWCRSVVCSRLRPVSMGTL